MAEGLQLFPALPAATEAALRDSIQRWGILVPVAVDQHGTILDGHHRVRLAAELGVAYPTRVHEVADAEEGRALAYTLNADRRQLTPEQRQEVAVALRKAGHSERAIAGALGSSQPTIHRDLQGAGDSRESPAPVRTVGLDGKSYPATRPLPRDDGPRTLREALADYPTPTEARTQARETGKIILDKTGHWQSGLSDDEAATGLAYHAMLPALETLMQRLDAAPDPALLVQHTPVYWHDPLCQWLPRLIPYLMDYHTALVQAEQGVPHA